MMINVDGINKLQADNKRLNEIIDSYQPRIQKYKDVLQEIKAIAEIAFAVCDDDCGNANKFKEIIELTKAEEEWK